MSHESNIHEVQTIILRELLFVKEGSFSALKKISGLTSDHFNFHVSRLLKLEYIEKLARGKYRLTAKGKEYANRLDTDNNTLEKQPKVAVLLAIERKNKHGETEFLLQERKKNPYFGYSGFPGGKIRWGETVFTAAARELVEETRLLAKTKLAGVYHELTYSKKTSKLLEDKMFFVVNCTGVTGSLMLDFEGGKNYWCKVEDMKSIEKKYASFDLELDVALGKHSFIEKEQHYDEESF